MSEEIKENSINSKGNDLHENDLKQVPGGEYVVGGEYAPGSGHTKMRCSFCYYIEEWPGYHVGECYQCPSCHTTFALTGVSHIPG